MKSSLFGLSVLLGLPCLCAVSSSAWAGDFSNPQKTYVPNSLIQRRYDTEPVGQTDWGATGNPTSPQYTGASASSGPLSAAAAVSAIDNASNPSSLSIALGRGKKTLDKLIEKGKWDDAEKVATKLLKNNPKDQDVKDKLTQVYVAQARVAYGKPDLETAARRARQALVTEPTNQPAKLVLCQVFTKKGWNFSNPKEHLKLADGLAAQSKFVEAHAEYHLALGIKPSAAGHVGLGNIWVSQGQAQEAAKEYSSAIQVDPKSSIAYRQLGSLRLAVHDLVGANRDLSQAVILNPNDELASSELIQLWQQQASSNLNSVNPHLGLARAYLLTGNLEAAQTEYRQVAQMDPNNPQLPPARVAFKAALAKRESQKCIAVAKTLNSQGAYRDARDKILESLNYAPATLDVLLLNGQVCEKLGLYDDAHDAYMAVLKEDPSNIAAAQHLKTLPARTNSAMPGNTSASPPVAPGRSAATGPASSVPASAAPLASNFDAPDGQTAAAAPSSPSLHPAMQVDDPLASVTGDVPSLAVAGTPSGNATATSTTTATGAPAISASAPGVFGAPAISPSAPAVFGAGVAPQGSDTLGHTSTLTTFFNSMKGLQVGQQQPATYTFGNPEGAINAQTVLAAQSSPVNGAYTMPGSPAVNVSAPMMANASNASNSSSANQSLMSFLATPIANKLGFQSPSNQQQQAQMQMVAMPEVVQGANGALYMLPTAVPMAVYNNQQNQGNPAWNDLTSSNVGQKFHLAQMTQVGNGVGSVLSNVKLPSRQNSQTGAMVPNSAQPSPLVQVTDWNTGSSGETDAAATTGEAVATSSDSAAPTSANQPAAPSAPAASAAAEPTEVALKPALGELSLAASMAHAVTLEIDNVKPTLTGSKVKLILKNNSPRGVNISEQQKIAFQIEDKPEQLLDIQFDIHHVPAGGSAYGIVKLPARKLDPDADLYLPKFLEDGKKKSDLHATAELTNLQMSAKAPSI
jgi:tetratricopeptide (TPR) repeat protein